MQLENLVVNSVKEDIKHTLGISNLGGMGKYLGIPESLGGEKSKIFHLIREKLQDMIDGWTSKFLSKGKKNVLTKSVGVALPTYIMSCFRLSKS